MISEGKGLPEDTKNFIETVESYRTGNVLKVIVTVKLPIEITIESPNKSVEGDRLLQEAKEMIVRALKTGEVEVKDVAILDVKEE